MYIPGHFRVEEREKLWDVIRENSFATVVTVGDGMPFASHLPIMLDEESGEYGTLVGHMSRANPQWQHFGRGEQEVFAGSPDGTVDSPKCGDTQILFQGPHAYISPTWYTVQPSVPTWNYVAVHALGFPTIIEDPERLSDLLAKTIQRYESGMPAPWKGEMPAEYKSKMLRGIVGFEMKIVRLEGKFKLGQNRSPEDIKGVYSALQDSSDPNARALAETMLHERMLKP